jgi:NAD+ synthetase
MRIALAQTNPVVGDIAANTDKMADLIAQARQGGAQLVVFPELSIVGYPPRDLLRKQRFVADNLAGVQRLAGRCRGIAALVGFAQPNPAPTGRPLQNAAALLADGTVQRVHAKTLLPTYDVFDETRYFEPGHESAVFEWGGVSMGLSICEDLWDTAALGRGLYQQDPVADLKAKGARVIINMAASPFQVGKAAVRTDLLARQARRSGAAIVYVNQVGGNDELIFDGMGCVVGPDGELLGRAASFREDLLVVDLDGPPGRCEDLGDETARLAEALQLGLRDFVRKCGLSKVVLGLSGGIDSALAATLAADALGPDQVLGLAMPSRYSSEHSLADARRLAANLGIRLEQIGIEPMHSAYESALRDLLASGAAGGADENIQARIRGTVVMAVSNAFGHMALATGNKSELSTGYCTLYGDMAGGLAPIGDVLKTAVYELARWINRQAGGDRIPAGSLTKAPSAELKPNQFDQDKLPPYDLLDQVLRRYVEADQTAEQIIAEGFDPDLVHYTIRLVDGSEFKRKQAPPVLKVSPRAFGTGRRMPIAQRYRPADPTMRK